MSWQQKFGALCNHVAQCSGPFNWPTLNLLWVTGIWEIPNNEITRSDPFFLWEPRPQVVICFATSMMELNFTLNGALRTVIAPAGENAQRVLFNQCRMHSVRNSDDGFGFAGVAGGEKGGAASEASDVAIAWSSTEGAEGWIVSWVDTRDGNAEVYAARVDRA